MPALIGRFLAHILRRYVPVALASFLLGGAFAFLLALRPLAERMLNFTLAATILLVTIFTLL
jgi:hypothetical protein